MKLSKDSEELFIKILFTNSYLPIKNTNSSDFLEYKLDWLVKKQKIDTIEEFLLKNPDLENNTNLLKYLIEEYLSIAATERACEKIKYFNKKTDDNYLHKFSLHIMSICNHDLIVISIIIKFDCDGYIGIESWSIEEIISKTINILNDKK